MSHCPDADDLLLEELGELTVNRSAALRAHVGACAACRARGASVRRLVRDLGNPPPPVGGGTGATEAFVARVDAAIRLRPAVRVPAAAPRWWRSWQWPLMGFAAATAVLALVLAPAARQFGSGPADDEPFAGTVSARGSGRGAGAAAPRARLAADVLLVRQGRLASVSAQPVRPADALAVRVTNLSGRTTHLVAFAIDAAGAVHWLYPGYLDERTNPQAVAIADGTNERLLGEVVQLETPPVGPLRLVTLLSREPLTVKEIEARIATRTPLPATVGALFPEAVAQEWTTRWEGTLP